MKRYVWVLQSSVIEDTDQIFVFSSKKKALAWLDDSEDYFLYKKVLL